MFKFYIYLILLAFVWRRLLPFLKGIHIPPPLIRGDAMFPPLDKGRLGGVGLLSF